MEGREYLEKFKVEETIRDAVAHVLKGRPADPVKAIGEYLKTLSSGLPNTFCSILPKFSVKDWALAEPIMKEFIEATKTEKACIYYGWTRSGDKLFCYEAYNNADGVMSHLGNVGPLVNKMLEAAATLDSIELHGPAAEVDKCKAGMDAFGTVYFTTDGGITFLSEEVSTIQAPLTAMAIMPRFQVKDWALAEPIMKEFIEATKTEKACIYYGWTRSGDKLFCREGYDNADGVMSHLGNVGPLVNKMLEAAATIDSIELHGPAAEVDKCKAGMDAFGTVYFTTDGGFQTFQKT